MKRSIIIAFLIACAAVLQAQSESISVKSFQALPMDMTASSLEGKRIDQNGQVAALIKIVTTETGFVFEGGTLGIVDTKQTPGEVWVWVPRAARKITIKHSQLGVLRDYRYPIEIESERTYEMVLTTAKVLTTIEEEVRQQYLIFELEPKNATLEVNNQLWSVDAEGTALQFVDFGTYTYRVRAANYETEAGVVTVDNPDPEKPVTVKVRLKSNFAEVTLQVDADAEIWVNNEKKGTRTWTGPLGKGTYKIECKQANHETTMISKEISADMNGQTITLLTPKPIYGSLNVESTPIGATIYIDGKEIGKTPRFLNEILIGAHELRLSKDGYADYTETITITQGERKQVKATLSNGKEIQFTCNVPNAQLEIDGQRVGSATGTYQLTYGNHSLKATADDYRDYTYTINVSESSSRNHNVLMKMIKNAPKGSVNGEFSVSENNKVYFSQGNLQYQASTNTWRFAEHQWEVAGESNKGISPTYNGWIDLFGWGTGNNPTCTSRNDNDYPRFEDWGNNKICNGGSEKWRTLSESEWNYVFNERKTLSGIRYAIAKVNGMNGVIIVPDNWSSSIYTLYHSNEMIGDLDFNTNVINALQWSTIEKAGAVFLPALGSRYGNDTFYINVGYGFYWSSSTNDDGRPFALFFEPNGEDPIGIDMSLVIDYFSRSDGYSVRLVYPIEN